MTSRTWTPHRPDHPHRGDALLLGIGVQRPIPSWGVLIADSFQHLQSFPYLAVVPCGILSVTILALNFVGEGVTEAMDSNARSAY